VVTGHNISHSIVQHPSGSVYSAECSCGLISFALENESFAQFNLAIQHADMLVWELEMKE
jgi:hypothetical protein